MFSVVPGDHLWAPVLVTDLLASVDDGDFALVSITDHDSRAAVDVLLEELSHHDRVPLQRLDIRPQSSDLTAQLARLRLEDVAAVLVVAGPEDGARLLSGIRERSYAGPIFGSPQLARRACLEAAGEAAQGLRVPVLSNPEVDSTELEDFETRFRALTGREPDWAASHTYDAARILLAAIGRAGLSRAAIREALVDLSPWQGVTGTIDWDPTGQNQRPVPGLQDAS